MKTILITGSTGFLGSNFIKQNSNNFKHIIGVTRGKEKKENNVTFINLEIGNCQENERVIRKYDPDIILHFAFDHSYNNNMQFIKSLVLAANKADFDGIFVLISSISVLKINRGRLTYNYNSYYDPYCSTKRSIDRYFRKAKSTFNKQIVYPTIVYGPGGNWNRFIQNCVSAESFSLPLKGEIECNFIEVDEFSKKLFSIIGKEFETILGGKNGKWIDLYRELQGNKKLDVGETKGLYHDNLLINSILLLWHKTPLGILFNFLLSKYYSLRGGYKKSVRDYKKLKHISPTFSNRFIHSSNFKV